MPVDENNPLLFFDNSLPGSMEPIRKSICQHIYNRREHVNNAQPNAVLTISESNPTTRRILFPNRSTLPGVLFPHEKLKKFARALLPRLGIRPTACKIDLVEQC